MEGRILRDASERRIKRTCRALWAIVRTLAFSFSEIESCWKVLIRTVA